MIIAYHKNEIFEHDTREKLALAREEVH